MKNYTTTSRTIFLNRYGSSHRVSPDKNFPNFLHILSLLRDICTKFQHYMTIFKIWCTIHPPANDLTDFAHLRT